MRAERVLGLWLLNVDDLVTATRLGRLHREDLVEDLTLAVTLLKDILIIDHFKVFEHWVQLLAWVALHLYDLRDTLPNQMSIFALFGTVTF